MVLITGTSQGIGKAVALYFLEQGYEVSGIDILPSTIEHQRYHHYLCDVRDKEKLPDIKDVEILFSNAGVQNEKDAIDVNLIGCMNVVEKYSFQDHIKSVLINASSSGHTGFEFTNYSVSKGGLLTYMKNVAVRLAKTYKATCNSLSLGGVITPLNDEVLKDKFSILWRLFQPRMIILDSIPSLGEPGLFFSLLQLLS